MKSLTERKWVLLGGLVLFAVGLVIYRASLDIGFWTDDYSFLDIAGRFSFPDYLAFYFDPRFQSQWYRPLQGMMWWTVYVTLGKEALGYHLVQVAFHLANVLLLYAILVRVVGRWRFAFIAGLVYLTLPSYALAVNWPGVADPELGLFFLLAVWFWVGYLQTQSGRRYVLAIAATIGALLTKEVAIVLPVTFFLADILLYPQPFDWKRLAKRYAVFLVILPIYALLEFAAITKGVFTQRQGYGLGSHILTGLVNHLRILTFPWGLASPLDYIWLAVVLVLLGFAIYKRAHRFVFLAAVALLLILPVLPFPLSLAQAPRYQYLALMASATAAAWGIESVVQLLRWRGIQWAGLALMVAFVWSNSASINEEAVNFAGTARQVRLQFRPIFQQHPTVGPDTFFYFVLPSFPTPNISGLMFQRYGSTVSVYGTDRDQMPDLRSHRTSYVCYPDDQNNWKELAVESNLDVRADPTLPIQFGPSIALVTVELASAHVRRDEAVVLLLYWKNTGEIDRNYSVFAHLVNAKGENVAGYDAQPRQGYSPTGRWLPGERLADAAFIPVDANVPPGDYRLELGMYDPKSMERLMVLDANGNPSTDKLVIDKIHVVE